MWVLVLAGCSDLHPTPTLISLGKNLSNPSPILIHSHLAHADPNTRLGGGAAHVAALTASLQKYPHGIDPKL